MGLNFLGNRSSSTFDFRRDSSDYNKPPVTINPSPNPNPNNYEIIEHLESNGWLLIKIKYPDCKNYEGIKILLFRNVTVMDLLKQKLIDPHFSENKEYKSPFARFEPTEFGWEAAMILMLVDSNFFDRERI
jgi:hypothetical protein